MNRIISYIIVFIASATLIASAENKTSPMISGTVTHMGKPVEFASIALKGSTQGAVSDLSGRFELEKVPAGRQTLLVSMVGYRSRELELLVTAAQPLNLNIELEEAILNLEQVVVTGTMREVSLKDSPVKMEVISGGYLKKSAGNNLIDAIGLINGLEVDQECSVCGTTGININGMESSNTAVLIDGMPIMGALASVYGLNGIPTEMIDRIEVLKGPSSTLYGSEAVAGVINVITRNPRDASLLALNTYMTSDFEKNLDITLAPLTQGRASTLLAANLFMMQNYMDYNADHFADVVLSRPRISLFNKWTIDRPANRIFTIAGKFYHENRFGGSSDFLEQYSWKRNDPLRGNDSIYGESIFTNRLELLGSWQLPINSENLRLDFSYSFHDQDSWYAEDHYAARQSISFANLIWTKDFGPANEFLAGLSARHQTYDDNTEIIPEKDVQFIPGLFVQNQFNLPREVKLLGGARLDLHKNHGPIFSPRFNASWKPATFTTLRLNTGTGFRIVNVFSEDHAAYHGIREVVIVNEIKPERSRNATLSLNHVFNVSNSVFTWDVDVFYTHFTNKIEADYDTDPTKLIYRNLEDEEFAVSRGMASSLQASFAFPLRANLGMTFQDVFAMQENEEGITEKTRRIKVPGLTGVYSLAYDFNRARTTVDFNGTYTSSMRMPQFDEPFSRPENSAAFMVHNLQFTQRLGNNTSLYLGVRNLGNYTQDSPLINPANPFDETFDTSYVYGPVRGRRVLIGLRMFVN